MPAPRLLTASFAISLATCLASGASAYVSGGHEYSSSCNPDGYVLTSLYPVVREMGQGAMTQHISGIESIYLGRSCDAFHPLYGDGSWCWANGGFVAEFAEARFGFARQELSCQAGVDPGNDCLCQ